jgi:hypothetical protein
VCHFIFFHRWCAGFHLTRLAKIASSFVSTRSYLVRRTIHVKAIVQRTKSLNQDNTPLSTAALTNR